MQKLPTARPLSIARRPPAARRFAFHGVLLAIGTWGGGCGDAQRRIERFEEGLRPDQPRPVVPPAPGDAQPRDRVILIAVPGLGMSVLERGMVQDFLPNLRRLRIDGLLVPAAPAPRDPVLAASSLWTFAAGAADGDDGKGRTAIDVGLVPSEERFEGDVPLGVPDRVPVVTSRLPRVPLADALDASGRAVLVERFPAGFPAFRGAHVRALGAGCLPDLGLGGTPYTFAFEPGTDGAPALIAGATKHGGVIVAAEPFASDADEDVFVFTIPGPRMTGAPDAARSTARIELRALKSRARARILTSEDEAELRPGRVSGPLRVRFVLNDDLEVFGRVRAYLRPTGLKSVQLYVSPAEFDPAFPLPWQPMSTPPDLAADLDLRFGPLPSHLEALPRAALADRVLGVRDAIFEVTAQHVAERRLFQNVLVVEPWDLFAQWFTLADDAAEIGIGRDAVEQSLEVEFLRERLRRRRLLDAAAAELDGLLGHALAAAVNGGLGPKTTVVVWSPYGAEAGDPGFVAISRVAPDPPAAPPTAGDVAATVCALLGVQPPAGIMAHAIVVGPPMPRFEIAETTAHLIPEDE